VQRRWDGWVDVGIRGLVGWLVLRMVFDWYDIKVVTHYSSANKLFPSSQSLFSLTPHSRPLC